MAPNDRTGGDVRGTARVGGPGVRGRAPTRQVPPQQPYDPDLGYTGVQKAIPDRSPLVAASGAKLRPDVTGAMAALQVDERRGKDEKRPLRRHPVVRLLGALVLVALLVVGFSVGRVLTAPGNDSIAARLAEWGRDHHLDFAVTWLEQVQYDRNKPKVGGTTSIPKVGAAVQAPGAALVVPHTATPAPVAILAGGRQLANEGQWQTVVTSKGLPAVRVAYVRPDDEHTSYTAGLLWMDPKLLFGRLHPGTQDPGGQWSTPSYVTPALQPTLAAANNGGFRLNGASRGGYWADGREPVPLRDGAASLVLYKNGTAKVGAWGTEVSLSNQVASVRQNLDLLVDKGTLNTTCSDNNSPVWGWTLGNASYVWRSGFGITSTGAMVYTAGNALSVCTLGRILKAAGVVQGMELDINPDWTTGFYYTHVGSGTDPHKLNADLTSHSADRYFTTQTRDFFGWYLRP